MLDLEFGLVLSLKSVFVCYSASASDSAGDLLLCEQFEEVLCDLKLIVYYQPLLTPLFCPDSAITCSVLLQL